MTQPTPGARAVVRAAEQEKTGPRCTCADAGDCFAPADHYADCPAAGQRYTADTITDDALDKLHAEVEQANEAARQALKQRQEMAEERYVWQQRGDRAEAAIERVRALRQPFVMWRDIAAALDGTKQPATKER